MENIRCVKLLLTFIALIYSLSSYAILKPSQPNQPQNILPYMIGKLLIKTVDDAPEDALEVTASSLGATPVKSFNLIPGLSLYEYDEAVDIQDALEIFMDNEFVEYAEPDYLLEAAATPNDPRFREQWGLENTGQTGGKVDADINASRMWDIQSGNQNIVIGVIDSGIDYNHQDLIPNLWHNIREIPGNGIDEDLNGYVDDYFGINALANTGNPLDDNAHGTHVSGTIGAKGNNSLGVVGVAQNVQIATCKFLGADGRGPTSDAIECLQYFANLKTRLINPVNIVATNNSWGSTSNSTSLLSAIRAHQNLGILFVAAASNDNNNNDVTPYYPANYDLSNVIAVAATDHNDTLASFSNYGKRTVHVAAPGVRILSTVLNQSYALYSGTSMATPHVTGLIAITASAFPTLDYKQIKNLVLSSGTPLSVLQNTTITGRRIRGADINGSGALTCSNQIVSSRLRPITNSVNLTLGSSIFLSALRINCGNPLGSITLYNDGVESVVLQDNGLNGDVVANDGIYSLNWRPQSAKTYSLNYGNGDLVSVVVTGIAPPLAYVASNVAYAYETISGTSLNASDESIHTVSVPFPIKFNGSAAGYSTIYISSNGTVSFTNNSNPGYLNRTLPTTIVTTLASPYWDDFIPSGANSNIYIATTGSAPNRRFIVEWRNLKHYNVAGNATFQAIFYENSPDIRFNYLDTDLGNSAYNWGASATVGVQTSTTKATLYSYNLAIVPSFTSLLFKLQ